MIHYLYNHQSMGRRSYQEDRCLALTDVINGNSISLLAVADGMGGAGNGDVAARIIIDELERFWFSYLTNPILNLEQISEKLINCILLSNKKIANYGQKNNTEGMGTTLTCAFVVNHEMKAFNVGDSRLYLVDSTNISQITKDHSAVQEAIDEGIDISKISVGLNAITNCLDGNDNLKIDVFPEAGNMFNIINKSVLLSTDGLHGFLTQNEIRHIFETFNIGNKQKSHIVIELVNKALTNGSTDNISCVQLDCFTHEIAFAPAAIPTGRLKYKRQIPWPKIILGIPITLILIALMAIFINEYGFFKGKVDNLNDVSNYTPNNQSGINDDQFTTEINQEVELQPQSRITLDSLDEYPRSSIDRLSQIPVEEDVAKNPVKNQIKGPESDTKPIIENEVEPLDSLQANPPSKLDVEETDLEIIDTEVIQKKIIGPESVIKLDSIPPQSSTPADTTAVSPLKTPEETTGDDSLLPSVEI